MKTACLISAVLLSGCASVSTRLPDISLSDMAREQVQQEAMAFTEMARLQDRLMRVAAPIMSANAPLCPKTYLDIGVKTHKLSNYPKATRQGVSRELGARETASILYVRPSSAADRAGIMPRDILLDNEDKAVSAFDNKFQNQLETEGTVRINRNGEIMMLPLTPEKACGYKVRLSMSTDVNAYADGRNITVTSGMMNFVESDEELALIIGHELAHNTMGHIRKIVTNVILSGLATRYSRPFESEADYVGMYHLVRAGYSPDGVEDVWRRLGVINPRSVARAKTHPSYPDRYLRITAARNEILNKQSNGAPLIPNFITGDDAGDTKS